MYTLKTIARRGTAFGMVASLLVATLLPAAAAFADALNPLTERSLLLSSSAPGYQNTDGSGNPTYAPPGSGPNGQKTGETFTFTVSTTATVHGMSFQYCSTAAGYCKAPGNNDGDFRGSVSDPGPPIVWDMVNDREDNLVGHANGTSDLDVVGTFSAETAPALPVFSAQYQGDDQVPEAPDDADYLGGNTDPDYLADMELYNEYMDALNAYTNGGIADGSFQIFINDTPTSAADWSMTARNVEDVEWIDGAGDHEKGLTGKKNYITLSSTTGQALTVGDEVKVVFKASENNYITNPGYGHFFVKINTYDTDDEDDEYTDSTPLAENEHVIDGGVTVANVMTDSIHIVTKVLETMSFSVGIQNPDTIDKPGAQQHGTCDPISQTSTITGLENNRLNLGNPNAEFSLETHRAWDVYSYWRLSSNSSGGATVYYSGNTLANTSGDMIADMPNEVESSPNTEQFGLAFVDAGLDPLADTIGDEDDTFQAGYVPPRSYPFITLSSQTTAPYDTLGLQLASTGYDEGTGTIDDGDGHAGTAKFKFLSSSLTIPEVIAQQDEMVISCATAKMRYVANIGADTPAGVYTTKINYLAAPQY